ncbi:hypothetical protein GJ496_010760 [Pomphorhynchus laevis]|nr:hypothetical protein GJ496_010760 [Pomphorhynchus laevis]
MVDEIGKDMMSRGYRLLTRVMSCDKLINANNIISDLKIYTNGKLYFDSSIVTKVNNTCSYPWIPFSNSCYLMVKQKKTWRDAQLHCERLSSSLLVIDEDDEFDFIAHNVSDNSMSSWVSFRYFNNSWRWSSGHELQEFRYFTINDLCNRMLPIRKRDLLCGCLKREKRGKLCMTVEECNDIQEAFICEKVVNPCLKYKPCGDGSTCVNTIVGYRCLCTHLWLGPNCRDAKSKRVQMIIAFILMIIAFFTPLSYKFAKRFCRSNGYEIIRYNGRQCSNCFASYNDDTNKPCSKYVRTTWQHNSSPLFIHSQVETISSLQRTATTKSLAICNQPVYSKLFETSSRDPYEFSKPSVSSKNRVSSMLSYLTILLSITLCLLSILIPLSIHSIQMHDASWQVNFSSPAAIARKTNTTKPSYKLDSQCHTIRSYKWQNSALLPISVIYSLCFIYVRRLTDKGSSRLSILPLDLFNRTHRFLNAAIFGLLTTEVLAIMEDAIQEVSNSQKYGILVTFCKKLTLVILIGMRRYPQLLSVGIDIPLVQLMAAFYSICDLLLYSVANLLCPSPIIRTRLKLAYGGADGHIWPIMLLSLICNCCQYVFASFVPAYFIIQFITRRQRLHQQHQWLKKQRSGVEHSSQSDNDYKAVKTTLLQQHSSEIQYTKDLLKMNIRRCSYYNSNVDLNKSLLRRLLGNHSKNCNRSSFGFSSKILSAYCIAFTLILNLTIKTCLYSALLVEEKVETMNNQDIILLTEQAINKYHLSLNRRLCICSIVSMLIFSVQIYYGLQRMQSHFLDAYKGRYDDIPPLGNFTASEIIEKSAHYAGYVVGYATWGYFILFKTVFFVSIVLQSLLSLNVYWLSKLFNYCVPLLLMYALKSTAIGLMSKFLFLSPADRPQIVLQCPYFFGSFSYFNLIFDCFLGMLSCWLRLLRSILTALLFMGRMDYSFMGRSLERLDHSYASYVAQIHLEVQHSHPILMAFVHLLLLDNDSKHHDQSVADCRKFSTFCKDRACKRRIRIRWFLAYTLIRNPGMKHYRKHMSSELKFRIKNMGRSPLSVGQTQLNQNDVYAVNRNQSGFVYLPPRDNLFKYDFFAGNKLYDHDCLKYY